MNTRMTLVLIACLLLVALPMAAQDKAPAKKPMAMCGQNTNMMAMHDKIQSTWNDYQKAATPAAKDAALKAHGEALAEMEAAHQKMMAGGCCGGDMAACKQNMAMGKGKRGPGKGMDCPCCSPDGMSK